MCFVRDDSYAKHAAGDQTTGAAKLEEWLGDQVVGRLRQWFKIRRETPNATERLRPEDFVAFLPEHTEMHQDARRP